MPAVSHPLLTSGSRGNDVKRLQTAIAGWGYSAGRVDGKFGPNTLSAVKRFDQHFNLAGDGACDEATWDALEARTSRLSRGARNGAVNVLQTLLNAKLGGKDLKVDGDFGPNTQDAVIKFQASKKLPQNGLVDSNVWKLL
jgi:peptidoglycan hydrolase-like protein with peptidoglycan-binding domain